MRFIVIGITDAPQPWFPPEVLDIIKRGKVFSGGKRHHEIVASLLPDDAAWIDITVPLDAVFQKYNAVSAEDLVVFASGDPLFFGFANTIQREMPQAEIIVYPMFNSLQMLAHRLMLPYHDMHIVSLTGRPWPAFDRALIERTKMIGILTDREHTPTAIAQRMLDYGYSAYTMHVGEHLGNPALERLTTLSLSEAAQRTFTHPNCLILLGNEAEGQRGLNSPTFGLPDASFALLDGREKMITKMPIRLLTLQALNLPQKHVLWDLGFCTGSVSIEARLQFPHLHIEAFEIRPACEAIIQENARRHGAPGISVHIGDFLEADCDAIPAPDAVFIGGHGGHLKEIMAKALHYLTPEGCMVFNSVTSPKVTTDSHRLWDEACSALGLHQDPPIRIQLNDYNPIEILSCRR